MIWNRLKKMQCPKCNGLVRWQQTKEGGQYVCLNTGKCTFGMSKASFDRVVGNLYKPKPVMENPDKNISELNNL